MVFLFLNVISVLFVHIRSRIVTFVAEARWRQENEIWLRMSRSVALSLVDYMQENNLSRADLAGELGVSAQYLSRILSGTENLSLKSVAKIESRLGVSCLTPCYV